MKVGNPLGIKEEYLFWQTARYYIFEKNYRLISSSPNENEIWLENIFDKNFPIIRIVNTELDWSIWLKNDIEKTLINAERIRRTYYKRKLSVFTIYITPLPPVDDYSMYMENPYTNGKVTVRSFIFVTAQFNKANEDFYRATGEKPVEQLKEHYDFYEIDSLKNIVLNRVMEESKKENKMFQNGKPRLTYVFLAIQILMFLILELAGGSQNPFVLVQFGAKFNYSIVFEQQWWRFFTSIFLHIGIFHLLMNSLALYYLGMAVERLYGNLRFLLIYLFSGFLGSVFSFVMSPNISAGASGAIFGCFGALLYFGLVYPHLFFRTMGRDVIAVIGLNLIIGVLMPSIDMAGHIGGLVGGFLASGIVQLPVNDRLKKSIPFFAIAFFLTVIALFFGYRYPNLM